MSGDRTDLTGKVSEFLEKNEEYLTSDHQEVACCLGAIAVKVKAKNATDPLVEKIQTYMRRILPFDDGHLMDSLNFFKKNKGISAVADLMKLMNIPIAKYSPSLSDLDSLLGISDSIDFTGFEFNHYDLNKLGQILLRHNIKSKVRDEQTRLDFAKICAQQDGKTTSKCIQNFGITNQEDLVEIAKLCAGQDGWGIPEHIQNFGITNQEDLVEIAKLCVQRDARGTPTFIRNFGITNQEDLVEIAKICAQQDGTRTASWIRNFGIEDQEELVEIAKLCAQQDGGETAWSIRNFGIEGQEELVEIAKLCAQHDRYGTASWIQYFNIENKEELVEIAKLCAQQNGKGTALAIQNFGITNQENLVEIAKLCAQQNGGETAEHIQNFGITNQENLVEIAKLCAQQDGYGTPGYIKNFGITNQEDLLEIAKLCSQRDGKATAFAIQNFGITNQEDLLEIAKLCANQNGEGTAMYIKKFEIEDKEELVAIAKICAQQDGEGTAWAIQNFGITSQEDLVEVAKLCANQSGRGTAMYIKKFEIEDKEELVAIAKICAQQDGSGTANNIKKFDIEDKEELVAIAKICAQESGRGAANNIKKFEIEDEEELVEIAKICAQQDGGGTADNIQNFGITNQEVLVEIAKLCANQSGERTAMYIKNFRFEERQVRSNLAIKCLGQNIDALRWLDNFQPFPDYLEELFIHIDVLQSNELDKERRKRFYNEVNVLIEGFKCQDSSKEAIKKWIVDIVLQDPHIQKTIGVWILQFCNLAFQAEEGVIDWIMESGLGDELFQLRNPTLRFTLLDGLFALANNAENRSEWEGVLKERTSKKGLGLMVIPLYGLQQQGIDQKRSIDFAQSIIEPMLTKNALEIQQLLSTAHLLSDISLFTSEQMSVAFEKVFPKLEGNQKPNKEQLLSNSRAVKGLIQLEENDWVDSEEDLSTLFYQCFEKLIPLHGFEGNASDKYDQIFANSRNPGALLTYAAGLKTLNEPETLNCLGRFVVSAFDDTFKEMRYKTEGNPHLKTVFEANPTLKERWSKDISVDLDTLIRDQSEDWSFDAKNWITEKIVMDRHLGDESVSFVSDYLEAPRDEKKKEIASQLGREIGFKTAAFKKNQEKEGQAYFNLKLQLACINLAKLGVEKKPKNLEEKLKQVRRIIKDGQMKVEFINDLEGVLKSLESQKRTKTEKETYHVQITDDPIDLLLVGEVAGSCQRVDGDPSLNKGLLGYLVDGKNRLLSIKDSKGKIVARCMLRLLWDGEKPVIYRERLYPDVVSQGEENAMNLLAVQFAEELELPITADIGGSSSYGQALHAIGGPAPYEYSDASGGVQADGRYTIGNPGLLTG